MSHRGNRRQQPQVAPSPQESDLRPLLTTSEVSELLSISASALCRWRQDGVGPRVVWIGEASPRYRREDVEAFIEERST